MTDKLWLEKVAIAAKVYNETRMCKDFQSHEVEAFVDFLYKTYGYSRKEVK